MDAIPATGCKAVPPGIVPEMGQRWDAEPLDHAGAAGDSSAQILRELSARRPVLGSVLEEWGARPVGEYVASLFKPGRSVSEEMLAAVRQVGMPVLGTQVTELLVAQLRECPTISTANHHAPLFYPAAFQANAVAALGAMERDLKVVPSFAGSLVPIWNSDYRLARMFDAVPLPRFGGANLVDMMVRSCPAVPLEQFEQLATAPAHVNKIMVILLQEAFERTVAGLGAEEIGKLRQLFASSPAQAKTAIGKHRVIGAEEKAAFQESFAAAQARLPIIQKEYEYFLAKRLPREIGELPHYRDQVSMLNSSLWQQSWGRIEGMPKLAFLPLEEVALPLIKSELLNPSGLLTRMIFDSAVRQVALERFEGIAGAWKGVSFELGQGEGTHFFWAKGQRGDAVALRVEGNKLVGRAGAEFELTPEAIAEGLRSERLAPGLVVTLMTLAKHGANLVGGYNQIQYLTEMRTQMAALRDEFSAGAADDWIDGFNPAGFVYGPTVLLEQDIHGRAQVASLSAVLRDPTAMAKQLMENRVGLTLMDAERLSLPEQYREIVPQADRDERLARITSADILRSSGIVVSDATLAAPRQNVHFEIRMREREERVDQILGSCRFDSYLGRLEGLEKHFGVSRLHFKYEGSNPTGTHKDRVSVAQAQDALRLGFHQVTLATCGNFGASMACVSARAGLGCVLFIPETYHSERVREMERFGAEIIRAGTTYEEAVEASKAFAVRRGIYDANPGGEHAEVQLAAYAKAASEIVSQLGEVPDVVAVPVSNGTTLSGLYRRFTQIGRAKGHTAGFTANKAFNHGIHAAD